MIVDVCTYNGEKDLWDIHYNILKDQVDEFIVVEFDTTFSGKEKTSMFPTQEYPEVKYCFVIGDYHRKYRALAESSPNTQGAEHWKREFMQKESIKDSLTHLHDDDIVFIGDVDEVWDPSYTYQGIEKIKLEVYTYFLNNRSSEEFWGTLVAPYRVIKGAVLNHLRSDPDLRGREKRGWHFTSMGGANALHQKLTDSYTQESYATPSVLENIAYNIENGRDFLGRDFTYTLDESRWPMYLKDNREKYAHLCK